LYAGYRRSNASRTPSDVSTVPVTALNTRRTAERFKSAPTLATSNAYDVSQTRPMPMKMAASSVCATAGSPASTYCGSGGLPAEEVRAVYEHLAEHYRQFGRRRPQILKGWSPQQGWAEGRARRRGSPRAG
jgi:hypothetical protein